MTRSVKVERLAKQKLERAVDPERATWDGLKDNAAMKEYYRDQARQELPGVKRTEAWTGEKP
jgi:hypothetical protein